MSNTENVGCLGFLLRLLGIGPSKASLTEASFPYRKRDDFLSSAELSFYHVILAAVGERARVCPKIRLGDVFFVLNQRENFAALNRINQKHVDFVVCEPHTMTPLFGIELDDASHARADRQARDEFVRQVFEAAALPLLRFPVQRAYTVQEIAAQMEPLLSGSSLVVAAKPEALSAEGAIPICPKCEVEMVQRIASKGERAGQPFYGCPNYPKCRQTVTITPIGAT